ncbi:MAG: thioredoxin family protein [Tangfeifania sp.]
MKKIALILTLHLLAFCAGAQIIEPIKWSFDSKQDGKNVELIFTASIDENWNLYDTELPEGGPIPTSVVFNDSTKFEFVGGLQKKPEPVEKYDPTFMMDLRYFTNEATLTHDIRLKTDEPVEISGHILFMGCDDETCLPPNEAEFSFTFNSNGQPAAMETTDETEPEATTSGSASGQSLWLFILISALAGLAAILTPCVFPMIPMTVSFFMRGSEDRGKAIRSGLFFGLSILLIFTLLGALFSVGIFGPNVGSILSTHWIPNLLFFLLFLVFAISFFGAFEIVLPNSLVNKTDSKAEKGGFVGAFFMLNKLPKSGGWLNAIKVVFAFILLAFGLKFLSNIDQVYGFGILSREVYLSVWIVVFFLLGMYFLGKIKFSHDSELPYVSVGRLFLAIATFSFVVYLFTGLFGSPLSSISALLPPQSNNQMYFSGQAAGGGQGTSEELCGPAKYADKLHLPLGLSGYFDYEQGLACAEEQNKPAFVVFKGHACANCKKMENSVWANPEALRLLSEEYVIIALYTDDPTKLPEDEWVVSSSDGKTKKTMGKKFLDLQITEYSTNSIPFHVIIEPDGTKHQLGVTFKDEEFLAFLKKGLE